MKCLGIFVVLSLATVGLGQQKPAAPAAAASRGFTDAELQQFTALGPIDTHVHAYQAAPEFYAMMDRLNLHVVDILVTETPDQAALETERKDAWEFVHGSHGRAVLCTTFNPFVYSQKDFAKDAIAEINKDFAQGAIAVKIWKNIGEQVKDVKGNYVLPDDAAFEPIYQDIAAHHKTLIAHVADPDALWGPVTPDMVNYRYAMAHPEWYMYNKPNAPSKAAILKARDHILEKNPNLRLVGAHLGSMEASLPQLGEHFDRYPNFAVDMAARIAQLERYPTADVRAFIIKYQDRLIYGTDNGFNPKTDPRATARTWEMLYTSEWRYLATSDIFEVRGYTVHGLALPTPVLRKIYHDNAIKWFPGVE